jgi:hypothetical protein
VHMLNMASSFQQLLSRNSSVWLLHELRACQIVYVTADEKRFSCVAKQRVAL